MVLYIDTPSEGRNARTHDGVLVDSDDFGVGEDLEGFLACRLQLHRDCISILHLNSGENTYIETEQEGRFHESPGGKMRLHFLI